MRSGLRIIISLTLARTLFIRLPWTFRLAISDRSAVASRDRGSIPRESSSSEATPDVLVRSERSKNKNSGNSVRIKLFTPGYSHSWLHSLCRLEGIFTKMPFAQKAMLRRSFPPIASVFSSPYLPNPSLPTAVIARELKEADGVTTGALTSRCNTINNHLVYD